MEEAIFQRGNRSDFVLVLVRDNEIGVQNGPNGAIDLMYDQGQLNNPATINVDLLLCSGDCADELNGILREYLQAVITVLRDGKKMRPCPLCHAWHTAMETFFTATACARQ